MRGRPGLASDAGAFLVLHSTAVRETDASENCHKSPITLKAMTLKDALKQLECLGREKMRT